MKPASPHLRVASVVLLISAGIIALMISGSARPQGPPPPPAAIWHVDLSATGANNGSNWTDAYNNPITALDDAIAGAAPGDFIFVADGHYMPSATSGDGFSITKELFIYGGFAGGETTIDTRAGLFSATVLDGSTISRVLTVSGVATPSKVVIDGFQIKDGYAGGFTAPGKGGGIYCEGSNLDLGNCIFNRNRAPGGSGGGLYFTGASGAPNTLNIKSSEFLETRSRTREGRSSVHTSLMAMS